MPSIRAGAAAIALALGLTALAAPARAEPTPLTVEEKSALLAGETILRKENVTVGERRYVGGLAYLVVAGRPSDMTAVLANSEAIREILPRTQFVEHVGKAGRDSLLELHQGTSMLRARYTIRVRSEPEQNRVRFWLDPSRPHAIDDAWGFFRYEPFLADDGKPAMLVTYGVMVDLGSGVIRSLYEEKLRSLALTVPYRLREYMMTTGPNSQPVANR